MTLEIRLVALAMFVATGTAGFGAGAAAGGVGGAAAGGCCARGMAAIASDAISVVSATAPPRCAGRPSVVAWVSSFQSDTRLSRAL